MPHDNIDSNQPIIQQAYACRELQCTGKRHNADYNKKYKETSRERVGFSTAAGNNKQLENENNDESYALNWVSRNDHKFKQNISIQPVLVDKEPNASVHNIDTYIVQHLHQTANNQHTIEREEETNATATEDKNIITTAFPSAQSKA